MDHTNQLRSAERGMTSSPDRRPNPGLHPPDSLFMIVSAIRLRKDHHKRSQRLPTVEPLQPEVSVLLHRPHGSLSGSVDCLMIGYVPAAGVSIVLMSPSTRRR